METIAIVQARMGSTRLPGKVMKTLWGKPIIQIICEKLATCAEVERVIVATTTNSKDDTLVDYLNSQEIDVFRGDEFDVLKRFYDCSQKYQSKYIVRLTADNPLIDPVLVDSVVRKASKGKHDFCSNNQPLTFPDGLDVEVCRTNLLHQAHREATDTYDREHVMPMVRKLAKSESTFKNDVDFSYLRFALDETDDYMFLKKLSKLKNVNSDTGWLEVVNILQSESMLLDQMPKHLRNEGSQTTTGEKLWKRAQKVILNGNSLLSKRPEIFCEHGWPTYFSKTSGIKVYDLDGIVYRDFAYMSVGTNLLGYSNSNIDDAVNGVVSSGNMSSLNCAEEVVLAERLVEICAPWGEKVRYARTGGEANAIALRIARSASGKNKVAICGYHGWHDWYLAANISNVNSLNQHLLPGLDPTGVPSALSNSICTFHYNDFVALENLVSRGDIGVVFMEVMRNIAPKDQFLQKVRNLCTKNGIVLIFDECSSGFKQTFGGLHKFYDVEPDIAMFGKALGNGYAITAVVGRQEVMDQAKNSFISSTFWTERIGPVAALATLNEMNRLKSWELVQKYGKIIKKRWEEIFCTLNISYEISGLDAMPSFIIIHENWLVIKQTITKEMLKRGYLSTNTVYVSTEHNSEEITKYFEHFGEVMEQVSKLMNSGFFEGNLEKINDISFARLN